MGCAGRGTSWRTRCWQSLIDMSIHTITHSWISNLDGMTMAAESGNNNNPKNKKKRFKFSDVPGSFFSYNIYTHFDTLQEPRDGWGKFIHQKNDGAWWWWWWWQFLFSILVSLLFLFLVKFWLRDKHHSWVAQKFIYKNLFPIWCRREGEKKTWRHPTSRLVIQLVVGFICFVWCIST